MTPVLVYSAPVWKDRLQRVHGPCRAVRIRRAGNVVHLPAPIAGYRIRHDGADAVVEIKPRQAPAMVIARCSSADVARQLIATLDHVRPFLGEIGRAA